jgi:predicted HTH transcriptional regulator
VPPDPRAVVEQRARDILDLPAEQTHIEFKRSGDFASLQYRITKTAMAMANLRDGGMVIIGVAQDQQRQFVVEGIDATNEASFVQETVYDFVNRYASPPVELRVLPLEHGGKRFIIMDIQPFERTPVVCKRNTPDGMPANDQLRSGDFFVRTGSPVSTQRVQSDAMMHEVLEFAVIRRLAEMQRIQRAALASGAAQNAFDAEVSDLGDL